MNKLSTYIRVRYGDTDKMGVVHHSCYINYFEVARTEFLRMLNLDYKIIEDKHGIMLPVVDLNCVFKSPAYYDDFLEIRTWIEELPNGARIQFHYQIFREDKENPIAAGSTTLAFVDIESKKVVRCPKFIVELLKISLF